MSDKTGNSAAPAQNKLVPILLAVLIVVICVMGYLLLKKPAEVVVNNPNFVGTAPTMDPNVIPNMSKDELDKLLAEQQQKAKDNQIIVSMPAVFEFPDGKSPGKVNIENVMENKWPFTVTVTLSDTKKTVLQTGLIAPNSILTEATLLENLPKGKYPAAAIYTTYDTEGVEIGKVGVAITVEVKS